MDQVQCPHCSVSFADQHRLQCHIRGKHRERAVSRRSRKILKSEDPESEGGAAEEPSSFDVNVVLIPSTSNGRAAPVSAATRDELESLVGWRERGMNGAQVAQVKADLQRQDVRRKAELERVLTDALQQADVSLSTLTEIAPILNKAFNRFEGLETHDKEASLRSQLCPSVTPRRRVLQTTASTKKQNGVDLHVKDTMICYDIPIEETIQLIWRSQPERYVACMAFLAEKQRNGEVSNFSFFVTFKMLDWFYYSNK